MDWIFGKQGSDRPDAVRVGDRQASWAQLAAAATAVADEIAGAPAVAVHAAATLETAVATVAALLAGVPLVPVPPDSGPLERDHILTDSGAALLLTPNDFTDLAGEAERADPAPVPLVPIDPARGSDTSYPRPDGARTAMILYTSGTTGKPKGVLLTRDALTADLDALADAWAWSADDVLVHGLPLYHIHGLVLGVLGALRTGCRLVHTVRPTPAAYAAAQGSLYFGVPTVWSRISTDPAAARALARARLLVSGSAPLPVPVFTALRALTGHKPVERYGMTETLITVSARADGERRPGHVGTALPGVRTRLAETEAQDGTVPHDGSSVGELQVRGDTLFSGYLNRPEATAESFTPDGWFRTGDVATIGPDGLHRIVGRSATDLIKCGGYRIGAGEVEDALLCHAAVREAAVVGAPHADLGQEIVAYVVADKVTPQELIDFVATRLSVHKRPRRVHLIEALPRNHMGKVQKKLLH